MRRLFGFGIGEAFLLFRRIEDEEVVLFRKKYSGQSTDSSAAAAAAAGAAPAVAAAAGAAGGKKKAGEKPAGEKQGKPQQQSQGRRSPRHPRSPSLPSPLLRPHPPRRRYSAVMQCTESLILLSLFLLQGDDDDELDPRAFFENRKKALAVLRAKGIEPFLHKFKVDTELPDFVNKYAYLQNDQRLETQVSVAGTIYLFFRSCFVCDRVSYPQLLLSWSAAGFKAHVDSVLF